MGEQRTMYTISVTCGVPGDWILYAGMSNYFFDGTTVRSGIVYIPVAPYLSFTDYWGALS
jgi:hypothetical protein